MIALSPGRVNGHKIFHTWSTSSGQSAIMGGSDPNIYLIYVKQNTHVSSPTQGEMSLWSRFGAKGQVSALQYIIWSSEEQVLRALSG